MLPARALLRRNRRELILFYYPRPSNPEWEKTLRKFLEQPPKGFQESHSTAQATAGVVKESQFQISSNLSEACAANGTIVDVASSLSVTVPLAEPAKPKRKRRSPRDVSWHEKRLIQGEKVSKTVSKILRDEAVDAADRAKALRLPLRVHLVMKPQVDHLDPVARMEVWPKYLNKVASHCTARRKATGRPFPCVFIAVRESHPTTHKGEHLHMLVHAPNRAEEERLIKVARRWCSNAFAESADALEKRKDGKVGSAIGYLLKAASPRSVWADPTIGYKPSGAIVGWRTKITGNLTSPEAVQEAEIALRAKKRVRNERARIARWGRRSAASS